MNYAVVDKMLKLVTAFLVINAVFVAANPVDPVLGKFSEGLRYDYMETDNGELQLVDNWLKLSDYEKLARYNPDASNRYVLFTWRNPTQGVVLQMNNPASVLNSTFRNGRRTIILMHGFGGSLTSGFNTVLVPAFLAADDCNVIVLDWSAGSNWGPRAIEAGQAAGRFVNWLMSITNLTPDLIHTVGYSVGGHGAGIMARTITGNVGYSTGLDPADRWDTNWLFRSTDADYTEVIHTNAGNIGVVEALGDADFYPNGGIDMPGCVTALCDHYRSYYYLAESLTGNRPFTGIRCPNVAAAMAQNCNLNERLTMGGLLPKTGRTGIYHLRTNFSPPFAQG